MSLIKRFMEDEAHYFKAGLEAGIEDNVPRFDQELLGVEEDAKVYAMPVIVEDLLIESLCLGWAQGQKVLFSCVAS